MRSKLICLALLVASCCGLTFAQAAKNNPRPKDWPGEIPQQVMHGRTVQAKLVLIYPPDAKRQDPSVVRIRIGVNAYGDTTTMKVLSGDKSLVKDAKTFLVKTKFPEAPKPDAVALSDPDNPPSYFDTYMPGGLRFQVYDVVFSVPPAKAKP